MLKHSPNNATGIVITDTMTNIHLQAGNPAFPFNEVIKPACIHAPVMEPRWPKEQKIAALVPSSDFLSGNIYISKYKYPP